jgi:hypothetical protein
MAKKEALDSVRDERPFAGVHILATAILCANGASDDELELARRLLEQDPKREPPREAESIAGAFNRHMDAAIDAVDRNAGLPLRAARRAALAAALDRAGLSIVDKDIVAALLVRIGELRKERTDALIAAGVCGMGLVEAVDRLQGQIRELTNWPDAPMPAELGGDYGELTDGPYGGPIGGSMADGDGGSFAGLEFIGDVGRDPLTPNVND